MGGGLWGLVTETSISMAASEHAMCRRRHGNKLPELQRGFPYKSAAICAHALSHLPRYLFSILPPSEPPQKNHDEDEDEGGNRWASPLRLALVLISPH